MADSSDEALLAAVAAGDRQAFARLSERHLARVHGLAWRLTGNRAEAEDIAQEVFVRLWTKADEWRPGAARLSTWLHRVTANLAIDARRRATSRVERPLGPEEALCDPAPDAETHLIEAGREAALERAIAALPERQRLAIVLTYGEGLRNAEVAEALGTSVKSVESLLVRARRQLQAELMSLETTP